MMLLEKKAGITHKIRLLEKKAGITHKIRAFLQNVSRTHVPLLKLVHAFAVKIASKRLHFFPSESIKLESI